MKINIIYHCDEWHSYSSFKFICVCDERNLKSILKNIQKELNYSIEDMEKYIHVEKNIKLNEINL